MNILVETFLNKKDLESELENLGLSSKEKETLMNTIEDMARYKVLNAVLNRLEAEDKNLFLKQLNSGSDEMLVETLREKIENIEEILRDEIREIESEVLADIRQIKS
jgi:hypothetical protein